MGIHGNRDGTDGGCGLEDQNPLGIVSHGDRDPVPLGDPEVVNQKAADLLSLALGFSKADPLLLIDDERQIAGGRFKHFAQRGRGMGKDLLSPATDDHGL